MASYAAKRVDEAAHERERFGGIPRVGEDLTAAGLPLRELHPAPQPLEELDHGDRGAWPHRVVVTRGEEGDLETLGDRRSDGRGDGGGD
jgi:hypothetical protein